MSMSFLVRASTLASCLGSLRRLSGSKASAALGRVNWEGRTVTLMLDRRERRVTRPRRPPRAPGEAERRAAILWVKAFKGGWSLTGRETQAMVLMRSGEREELYSGEAIMRAWW